MMSQTSAFPLDHGMTVIPSGLRPSERKRPIGSSIEGTWIEVRERLTSFIEGWVSGYSSLTPAATQSMCARCIHYLTTMLAVVFNTEGGAQT